MLESQTFLGEESAFTSDRVRAEQEYVRAGQIFGINRNVFIMSICAAFNSVIIGFNIGVFGEIVYILQDDMDLDMYECGILVGVLNFVAIFGSIVAGYTSDWDYQGYSCRLPYSFCLAPGPICNICCGVGTHGATFFQHA